jgi:hypothetical protein
MNPLAVRWSCLMCTVAPLAILATPAVAAAQPQVQVQILVGEGALTPAELDLTGELVDRALSRYAPPPIDREGHPVRLRLTIYVRSPRLLHAALFVLGADGELLGGFSVRSSGKGVRALLETVVPRILDDAARTLGWTLLPSG